MAELTFDQWKSMAELQLKFMDSLGAYQAKVAEAELKQAEANYQNAKTQDLLMIVRAKEAVVRQLELDMYNMNRTKHKRQAHIDQIGSMGKKAAMIREGDHLDIQLVGALWQGYEYFSKLVPSSILDQIMDTQIDSRAREANNFVLLRDKTTPCINVPTDLANVIELIEWMRGQHYMPKRGKYAYRQIIDAFGLIAGVADIEIAKIQKDLADMEKGTYETWKPVELLGITHK